MSLGFSVFVKSALKIALRDSHLTVITSNTLKSGFLVPKKSNPNPTKNQVQLHVYD